MTVYESMTAEQRTERARKAASARWANYITLDDRREQTAAARAAAAEVHTPEHFRRMAAKSLEVRRAKAAEKGL